MIDIHSHILPGLDDGAADLEESLAILRTMVDDGVRTVVATPHVRSDYPTTPDEMRRALSEVTAAAVAEGLPVALLPGGELAVDALVQLSDAERAAFGLGGRETVVLVEMPYFGWSSAIADVVGAMLTEGVTPVLAHPERNPSVQERPELLVPLVRSGALVQVTAASLDGRLGSKTASCAHGLIHAGLVDVVASDAHGPDVRQAGLSSVARALGDVGLARWLTVDAPAALLAGEPLSAQPVTRSWRRWRRSAWKRVGG